jgi:hypothetical protein
MQPKMSTRVIQAMQRAQCNDACKASMDAWIATNIFKKHETWLSIEVAIFNSAQRNLRCSVVTASFSYSLIIDFHKE